MNRIIIRHVGPPGNGVPAGGLPGQILSVSGWVNPPSGTGAAVGPNSSVNNRLVAFDGTTGKLLKDSGILFSDVATITLTNNKVDKVTGKGLSTNDFTNTLKAKLDSLGVDNYRGQYATVVALTTAVPAGLAGDYALVGTGATLSLYLWDTTANTWVKLQVSASGMTGAAIADILFDNGETWNILDSLVFTPTLKAQIESHETVINSFTGGSNQLQPLDPTLTVFAALTNGANQLPYFTGTDLMATATFTDAGRTLVGALDLAAQKTILGIGATDPRTFGANGTSIAQIRHGLATLVAGVVTVSDTTVTATTRILLTPQDNLTLGNLRVSARVASTSFTITSTNSADTGVVAYMMIQP